MTSSKSTRLFAVYLLRCKRLLSIVSIALIMLLGFSACPTFAVKTNLTSACSICSSEPSPLSSNELIWEKAYGGVGDDRAFDIVTSKDSGFLAVGSSTSFETGRTVGWAVKIDSNGNMLWNKTYRQEDGSEFRRAEATSNGYLLAGNTFSYSGDTDGWVLKIDDQGNLLWNKTFGGKAVDKIFSATTILDGLIFAGLTYSYGNGNSNGWIIKTDSDGNLLWNRTYGGSQETAFRDVLKVDDNSYVIAGYSYSTESGYYDFLLMKTNQQGEVVWNRTFGGLQSQKAYALARAGNGFLMVGETHMQKGDVDALVTKTDFEGKMIWQKTYGGDKDDTPNTIVPSLDQGYVVAGYTFSFGKGQRDCWLFKLDDSGNVLWSRVQGREAFEEAYAVTEIAIDEFVLGGWTNSFSSGSYDFYVVNTKVDVSNDKFCIEVLICYVVIVLGVAALASAGFLFYRTRKSKNTNKTGRIRNGVF